MVRGGTISSFSFLTLVVFVFLTGPFQAKAGLLEPCGQSAMTAGGNFFSTYESVEYSPEGYLIHHFKLKPDFPTGLTFTLRWDGYDDNCQLTVAATQPSLSVTIPPAVLDWSIRFTSINTFEVWNDQDNTLLSQYSIVRMPSYTRIEFRGQGNSLSSVFRTRTHKIYLPGQPPEFENVVEKPTPCNSFVVNGSFFDTYERAEYVDNLLRVHLRFKSSANAGSTFRSKALTADTSCAITTPAFASLLNNTSVTPYVRYFSFRMTSPTHWVLWDDESDVQLTCAGCQGDIAPEQKYVSFYGVLGATTPTSIRTTPFRPHLEECCSSVAFLPGIKGSVLTSGTDTLWPPTLPVNLSNDLVQLALHEDGTSVYPVTVAGVLEEFYSVPIYSGFVDFLNGLVSDGTIDEWKPLPYDWRYSPADIVANDVETPGGPVDIADQIIRLAADSETGKVSIVAHSYGGLVGKALIQELQNRGKEHLVESFVMVGSPQTGTPQAIASLLHGDDEGVLGGIVVNAATVREVAENMPGTYHLLPSRKYFEDVHDPVIIFNEDAAFTEEWRAYWGNLIGNYFEFFSFLTGGGVARIPPPRDELLKPAVLNPAILADADAFHQTYDTFDFPDSMRVVEVAGWGVPTVKSIEYKIEHLTQQSYQTHTTLEGDSTVVYPSALSGIDSEKYFFNLEKYRTESNSSAKHRDLLSQDPIKELFKLIIQNENLINTIYVQPNKPDPNNLQDKLLVSTHSPVIIGAYDSLGRFTGIDASQDLNSDLLFITEDIPGSSFLSAGGSHYVFLPKGNEYSFVLKGIGDGPTTLRISEFSESTTTPIALYTDFPVTEETIGTFVVDTETPENTELSLDLNGDGEVDEVVASELNKKPLTVTANSATMLLGGSVPTLSASFTGFAEGDTKENSVTGLPECITTATNTSLIGTYPITCSIGTLGSDKYEFETFVAGALSIQYRWTGFTQPIDDPTINPLLTPSVFKGGSTIPVKFQLKKADGTIVEASTLPLWNAPVRLGALSQSVDEAVYSVAASTGSSFKYDSTAQQYIYNWSTKGFTPGYWYRISAKLDDGTIHSVVVGLR